jgi:hypothetical protein
MKLFLTHQPEVEGYGEGCKVDDGRLVNSIQWLNPTRLSFRVEAILPVASRDAL